MLRKRLIGVVTVKGSWAVQSFSYRRYLPLGKPECLVENLDRWGADEILVLSIDRSRQGLGPDFELLQRLSGLGLSTPLIYGGGIRSLQDGVQAIQLGADRICLDALLHDDMKSVLALSQHVGAQALVAALPLAAQDSGLEWLDYRCGQSSSLSAELLQALDTGVISEALLIDWRHEGIPLGFDVRLVERFPVEAIPLIAFGGLSDATQTGPLLAMPRIAAVAVGNFLSYREHAIQAHRESLGALPLRPAAYEANGPLPLHE